MGLNIKNEKVHELARRAAAATGKSQTGAIEEALTRLLESLGESPAQTRRHHKVDAINALLAEIDGELAHTQATETFSVEDLYDKQTGLPR